MSKHRRPPAPHRHPNHRVVVGLLTVVAISTVGGGILIPAVVDRATRADATGDSRRDVLVPQLPPTPTPAGAAASSAAPTSTSAAPATSAAPPKPQPQRPPPKPKPPAQPKPVAGLNQQQMNHAATVVRIGKQKGVGSRGQIVALMTVLQESDLKNLANPVYPESFDLPHEGSAEDHDSVGLFQQRPSQGWGSVEECMTPGYAAGVFYERLKDIPGWDDIDLADAAQLVQRSAFPGAYAKHEDVAREVVEELGG